eukprot:maker-scaffold_16-snap-gene-6.22-mRNA-1 protein AED:0.00 eAED:0.00 QI:105/1/1/1/1/1/2/1177/89
MLKQSSKALKEVRLLFCPKSDSSAGLRAFVQNNYAILKLENPNLPILVRYATGTEARIMATFPGMGEKVSTVENKKEEEIKTILQKLIA